MKLRKAILCLLLAAALLLSCGAAAAFADPYPFNLLVLVGDESGTVRAAWNEYAENYFLSLTDLSTLLRGTPRAFTLERRYTDADGEFYAVTTGRDSDAWNGAGPASDGRWASSLYLSRNRIFVDGAERRYYTCKNGSDLYMSLTDIQLMLDLPALFTEEGLRFFPEERFRPDVPQLSEEGYFGSFSAVLLGDAESGRVLYSYNAGSVVPVASLTKLMTYLLLAEGADRSQISFEDQVVVSAKAAALSQGADAMVSLAQGKAYPFRELLAAMLLASSNECALALAEHLDGSEALFVEHMNLKARELGMEASRFYNPHGLPGYMPGAVTNKIQNLMSAEDLFLLCQVLLRDYPEITEITRLQFGSMPSLKYITANSNALVFNLEGCSGLKTGSTNKAGSCLVATLPVTVEGETHTAVAIVLGSEGPDTRNQAAEILLRFARDTWEKQGFLPQEEAEEPLPELKLPHFQISLPWFSSGYFIR